MVYYINCKNDSRDCNSAYKYVGQGKDKRVNVIATRDIGEGEEIFAKYWYLILLVVWEKSSNISVVTRIWNSITQLQSRRSSLALG